MNWSSLAKTLRNDIGWHALLLPMLVITYLPFYSLIVISLKDLPQFYRSIWIPSAPLHVENYAIAWQVVRVFIFNSIFYTSVSVLGVLAVASMSGFVFARYRFPGHGLFFYLIISLMMVPGVLTLIPSFVWMKDLGLLNTRWVLILPYISSGQVFGIFILRGFFAGLPEELFESARVDGATIFQCFRFIALPLAKPMLGVVAIMNTLWIWNDYVWPLITIAEPSLRPLTSGLAFFVGQFQTEYGPQMAGSVIGSIPLLTLFFLTMSYFVRGLTSGALKI